MLALNTSIDSEPSVFSLADAIAFAQQHSPRLRSARAAIERASGQEQAAFAPFLPEIDLLFQSGATSNNQGPGATGPTGFILPSSTPGPTVTFRPSCNSNGPSTILAGGLGATTRRPHGSRSPSYSSSAPTRPCNLT
jgi:hypothetical protein